MTDLQAQPSSSRLPFFATILFFGTLWGATEATVGGLLHLVLPPMATGRIMLAFSMAVLALGVRRTGSAWLPLGMALVAAPLKLLAAPIYGLPLLAPQVVNPAFAILAEGTMFAAVASLLRSQASARQAYLVLGGAMSGALWGLPFAVLVRLIGLPIYPPRAQLLELGLQYPDWATSGAGILGFVLGGLASGALAGLIGAAAVMLLVRAGRWQPQPAWLMAGSGLWLILFLASSWLM